MIISRFIFIRMRNVSGKICKEIKTHILCSKTPHPPENRAMQDIMWDELVEPDRPQMTRDIIESVIFNTVICEGRKSVSVGLPVFFVTLWTRVRNKNREATSECFSFR